MLPATFNACWRPLTSTIWSAAMAKPREVDNQAAIAMRSLG